MKNLKDSFNKVNKIIKELSQQTLNNTSSIEENKKDIARLEGMISVLMSESQVSESKKSHKSLIQVSDNLETKMLKRLRKSKKDIIITQIEESLLRMKVIDVYEIIVKEKHLCSKATFYRYIASLKSQETFKNETKNETKEKELKIKSK